MSEAARPEAALAGGPERVVFNGTAGRLVGDRWPADPAAGPSRGAAVLLHGGGQTRHSWGRAAARFADAGWDAVTLDLRGHGDSEWAPDADYGIDAYVQDLLRVVEQLGEPPVLVGASLGGITSLVGAGEHPGTARALVLVDIAPRIEAAGVRHIREFMTANLDGFASLEEVADAVQAYTPHRARPRNLEGLKKNVRLREDGRWYWHWDPAFLRLDDEPTRQTRYDRLTAAAQQIRVPTMLVRGAQSDVVTPEGAAELQALIPGAVVVEAKAGHMVAGDDNDVFVGRVGAFLHRV